jgi:hypothetical protein
MAVKQRRIRGVHIHQEGRLLLINAKSKGQSLTYAAIGKECNRNESTVKRFFNGNPVDKESALRICGVLKVDIKDVIDTPEGNPLYQIDLSEDNLSKLTGAILFLESLIPSATHRRLYEDWLYTPNHPTKLKNIWNPSRCTNKDDRKVLETHWKAKVVSLAHHLENLHIVCSYIKSLEDENVLLQKIRNLVNN